MNEPGTTGVGDREREGQQAYRPIAGAGRVGATRLAWVIAYALLQPIVMMIVLGVFIEVPDPPDIAAWVTDRELWGMTFCVGVMMAFVQVALVVPVFPSRRGHGQPSWVRSLISGFGVGSVIAVPLVTALCITSIFDAFGVGWIDDNENAFYLMLGASFVLGVGIAMFMRMFCRDGVPLVMSVVIAAFIAAALVGGMVSVAGDALNLCLQYLNPAAPEIDGGLIILAGVGAMALSWIIFTPLMLAFKGTHEPDTYISRLASRLFIGTVVEVVATIPVDIMVRRRTSCHCSDGSFWALIIGLSAGFIVLGPVVVLLPLGRRFQRRALGRCRACGFDMRGCLGAPVCPECGSAWAYQGPALMEPASAPPEGNDPPRAG